MNTVHYDATKPTYIVLGQRAAVTPIDHPDSENVSNTMPCLTTPVQSIHRDSKGEIMGFNTRNSCYKAIFPLAKDVIANIKLPVEELETIIEELEAGWLK